MENKLRQDRSAMMRRRIVESTTNQKIQRQPTANTKVKDNSEGSHAEGIFHSDGGESGYLIVPKEFPLTKAYYDQNPDQKAAMDQKDGKGDHLYDTFWSLAKRFNISPDALEAANPGLSPGKLLPGTRINIPNAPPAVVKDQPTQPVPKEPEKKQESATDASKTATKKQYKSINEQLIQDTAALIVQKDGRVRNAYLFLGQIKSHTPEKDWDKELDAFLSGGRKPNLRLDPNLDTQGSTPPDGKSIIINRNLSFPNAVYITTCMSFVII